MILLDILKNKIQMRIVPFSAYELNLVKAVPARRWDDRAKVWTAPATATVALAILNTIPEDRRKTTPAFDAIAEKGAAAGEAQEIKTADDLAQPPLRRMNLWKHQLRAYHFGMALDAVLFDMGMGSGKSAVGVNIVINRGFKRVLIAAPKSVIEGETKLPEGGNLLSLAVWAREFYKHAGHDRWAVWNDTRGTCEQRGEKMLAFIKQCEALGKVAIVLINYEATWRPGLAEAIYKARFDCAIADESHRIKSPRGSASKFFEHIGDTIPHRYALTGTVMPHSPLDVYAQFRFLDKGVFGTSYTMFKARYAISGGFENKQVLGFQNQQELMDKIGSISFKVGSEVLDLPEAISIDKIVTLSPKTQRVYEQMEKTLIADIDAGRVVASNALARLLRLQQITSGYLPDENGKPEIFGKEKREALLDIFEDLEPREPVVVFARFANDLDQIRAAVEESGRTYSELSGRERTLKKWQDGETDVIGVQIQAGGVGIDLTRACYCIYYSMGFSLGDYLQSLARVHRPGQHRSVRYIHIVAGNTIDQKVYQALDQRLEVINELFSLWGKPVQDDENVLDTRGGGGV